MSADDKPVDEELDRWLAAQRVERIRNGDPDAMVWALLDYIEEGIDAGHPLYPLDVQLTLFEALFAFVEGRRQSLDRSLGLDTSDTARANRRRDALAFDVYRRIEDRPKGMSKTDAKLDAQLALGLSARQVDRYYRHVKETLVQRHRARLAALYGAIADGLKPEDEG